jgi:hypothetical protein
MSWAICAERCRLVSAPAWRIAAKAFPDPLAALLAGQGWVTGESLRQAPGPAAICGPRLA